MPSLESSLKVIPAAVPPPMKAPITPPLMAQSPQYLGWLMFAHPASAIARNAGTKVEISNLHEDLRRIVPPTAKAC
jgi:hypothetical protein